MNNNQNPIRSLHSSSVNLFRTRLIAKICIILVCAFQIIPRLIVQFMGLPFNSQYAKNMLISFSFLAAMILIIIIEYILFKKKGQKVIKYSNLVDIIVLFLFLCDWIAAVFSSFQTVLPTQPPSFRITALYGFTVFAWRTLLVALIVQKWYLKVLLPVIATLVTTGYTIYYWPEALAFCLIRSSSQIVTMIVILYCEDKLKWKMMWMNLQQEQWIQVNNFILNNIPENIMILNLKGEVRFASDYCKDFMQNCGFVLGNATTDFFQKICNLHQQENEMGPSLRMRGMQVERMTTGNELMIDDDAYENELRIETLQDLITNFKKICGFKSLQEREFLIYNGKLKIEEGQEKSIEIKISFVQNVQDEYIILIIRDTTQRDRLVALEETNKYKDQLLASVSHELRAPLNGNINLVESAVNSNKIPESVKENLLIPALRSSKFLLHIINDILDMSQIKEKKLRLVFQSGDLIETIKSTAQLVELQAKKKGIGFELQIDPELSKNFCTDHIRLSQIILNLINNAIKFTKEGGTVKLLAIRLGEDLVEISVEDTGIGMTEENVKKLFSNYTHIEFEGRQKMNPTGVGLGLNIAYNLAELLAPEGHQGIQVKSVLDHGSTFTFIIENKGGKTGMENEKGFESSISSYKIAEEFPGVIQPKFVKVQSSLSVTYLEGEEKNKAVPCLCPKILVVDDNPFNTMAFETILSSLDVKCDSVYSGACAIKKLLNRESERCCQDCKPYGAVFMDQEMPEMSGAETTREIRRLQRESLVSPLTKVIGCTAHKSKEEVEKFMEAGLDQCIHKPISPGMIKGILSEFVCEEERNC